MTQVINKKLMKCCDCCKRHFDKPCAWLSLANEYCDEILETQKVIDQLTNNWNELEKYIKERIEEFKNAGKSRKEIKAHQYYMLLCDIEKILNSSL